MEESQRVAAGKNTVPFPHNLLKFSWKKVQYGVPYFCLNRIFSPKRDAFSLIAFECGGNYFQESVRSSLLSPAWFTFKEGKEEL